MKKILALLIILAGLTIESFGQNFYFNAYSFTYRPHHKKKDYWLEWKKWKECDIDITMDSDAGKIKINSKFYQEYNIIQIEGRKEIDGNDISSFYCVDKNGIACRVKLVGRNNGGSEIYVEYKDIKWVYAVTSVK
jgi:hypothetical protein